MQTPLHMQVVDDREWLRFKELIRVGVINEQLRRVANCCTIGRSCKERISLPIFTTVWSAFILYELNGRFLRGTDT